MIIYTHYNLDLDAASTAALALMLNKDVAPKVAFVGADVTFNELLNRQDFEKDYLILDIDCEGKGLKGETISVLGKTYVKSAFSLYLNRQKDQIIFFKILSIQ